MAGKRTLVRRDVTGKEKIFVAILLAGLLLRAWLTTRVIPNGLFDDAYITLRYARNIVTGHGFVYNPGEHVWGTTTPLFTMLLSGLGYVVGERSLEAVAVSLGVLGSIVSIVFSMYALREASVRGPLVGVYVLALAFLPSFVSNSVSGMETPIVLALMALSLWLYVRGRWTALGLVGGLLFLLRVDTAIWLATLAVHTLIERKPAVRDVGKAMLLFLASVVPWLTFATLYFGSVIPQSAIGKAVSHGAFQGISASYARAFLRVYFPVPDHGKLGWLGIGVGLFFTAMGIKYVWSTSPRLRPLCTFFVTYNAAFFLSRAPLFSWYFVPGEWAFYLFLWAGLHNVLSWIVKATTARFSRRQEGGAYGMAWAILGAVVVTYGLYALHPLMIGDQRTNKWLRISAYLEKYTQPEARIFLEHIGLIGYRTDRYIYDSMGLVTPQSAWLKRRYGARWLAKALSEFRPDVVLLYESELPQASPEIDRSFVRVARFATEDPAVVVFFAKNSPNVLYDEYSP